MANVSLRPTGVYSVVELEKVTSAMTGQGVMQGYELDSTDYATDKLQNGQCVRISGKTIYKPDAISDIVLLNATDCEIYEDGKGRETFAVTKGKGSHPRLLALNSNDVISTNACFYADTEYATLALLKTAIEAGTVFAVPNTSGDWLLTGTTTNAVKYAQVTEYVTLSNDRDGVRLVFI